MKQTLRNRVGVTIGSALLSGLAATGPLLAAPPVPGDPPAIRSAPSKEAPAAPAAANPGAAKATTLVAVLTDLRKEATEAWLGQKPWPRDKSNYAQDKNITLPNEDLVRALSMHLSDTPPIDGYIRWQLLSFNPDLSKLDLAGLRKFVASMPTIAAQPDPPRPGTPLGSSSSGGSSVKASQTSLEGMRTGPGGISMPTQSVASTGVVGPAKGGPTLSVEAAQANLQQLRQATAAANVSPLAFRDGVLEAVPKDGGMRAFARIEDLKKRVIAGDESFAKAAERLFAETAAQDVTVRADLQKPILGGLRELAQLHTTMVESFETQPNGRPGIRVLQISLPVKPLGQAAADLKLENATPFPGP